LAIVNPQVDRVGPAGPDSGRTVRSQSPHRADEWQKGTRTWAASAFSLGSRAMANTQGPQGNYDPSGNTQMFRAFVDEAPQDRHQAAVSSGPRVGLIVGVIAVVVIVAAVAWLALK
jgi:hypothetical protein